MKIKELRKLLRSNYQGTGVIIRQPWELLKFRYLDQLEVINESGENEHILRLKDNIWEVESKSRGQTDELKSFSTESEACSYLFKLLTDPSFQ